MLVKKLLLLCSLLLASVISIGQNFDKLREKMVKEQLEDRGISSSAVLHAMRTVERHLFVPKSRRTYAYEDGPQPIGEGQTISQPYIVAFMTEALQLRPTDLVLEIGTGSGYQAAILGKLCREVYTIEIVPSLGQHSDSLLHALGFSNIHVRVGDGYAGWPEMAPFDAIIVTCSPSQIPLPLQDQLKEGGRLIIPVGDKGIQHLVLLTKQKGKIKQQRKLAVLFVPMKDKDGKRY